MKNRTKQVDIQFALKAAKFGAWEINLNSNQFYWDERCSTLFGLDVLEPYYQDVIAQIHPDDRQMVDYSIRSAMTLSSGRDFQVSCRTLKKEGNKVQLSGCCEFTETGQPIKFAGIAWEIADNHVNYVNRASSFSGESGQKSTEEVLQESEENYHALFNYIDQGCYIAEVRFDAGGQPIDIFYQDANPAAYRMTGFNFKGKLLSEINPDYEKHWYEIFGRVAQTGNGERMQRYAFPDQKWYDFYVFKIGQTGARIAVIFQDITERARREVNQAFLATITNDLSQLSTAEEIMETVSRKISEYLEVKSCVFVDVANIRDEITVFDPWSTAGTPGLRYKTIKPSDFINDEFSAANRVGDVVVVKNTEADPRSAGKDYRLAGVGAFISVPFHRNSVWTSSLVITDSQPRSWTDDEIDLFCELAYRIFPRLERARAEAALRQSEEKFRSLFQTMREGFMVSEIVRDQDGTAIDYRFLMLNPAYEKLAGLSAETSTGRTAKEMFPDIKDWDLNIYASVVNSTQPVQFENFSQGLGKWFSVLAYPAGDDRFGVLYNDITDQKQQEANLAFLADIAEDLSNRSTAEEIMASVGKKIGAFLGVKSCLFVDVDDPNGLVTVFDAWNSADVPNLRYQTIRLSDFISAEFSHANRIGNGVVVGNTYTDPRAAGNDYSSLGIGAFITIPFHRNGLWTNYLAVTDSQPRAWREHEIGVFRELSNRIFPRLERARAEESLRRVEQRTRIAIEAADMATWEWNLETNEVYWNEQHYHLLGIDTSSNLEQLLDKPRSPDDFIKHIHPDDLGRINEDLNRTIRELSVYDSDFRIVRTDGTVRWMSGYGRITAEKQGRATRFSGVMFDIDARKHAEHALLQANKNKDEFLATLAHELRNPLAPIRNTLHILNLTAADNNTVIYAVAMMNRQVDQLVRLIDDLLDVSRINQGKIQLRLEQIDFLEVIHQAIETTSPLFDLGQRTLLVTLPEMPVILLGDTTRLIQVVSNLLNNAAKFTLDGGRIEMLVQNRESEMILTISDNGIGIADNELERIFELFAQSDTSLERLRGGLGLGLTLVRQLVQLHSGQVTASSEGPHLGSTFTVHLPSITQTSLKL